MVQVTIFISRNDGMPITDEEIERLQLQVKQSVDDCEYECIAGVQRIDEGEFVDGAE